MIKHSRSATDRFCYMDETGNTGLNHFDEAQESFIQGCVVANADLDIALQSTFDKIQKLLGIEELHANELGTAKLNKLADTLREAIIDNDISFIFTVIDKKYYVSLMIFHLIFDPGINPAVHSLSIWNRHLRLALSFNFITLVDEENCRNFWMAAKNSDEKLFIAVLKKIIAIVKNSHLDTRSQDLIYDALAFTIENPSEIFKSMTFDGAISSNLSAFSMMLNTINQSSIGSSSRIIKLVHDEQKEFASFLKQSFKIFSKVMLPTDKNLLITEPVSVDLIQQTELVLVPSTESYGIQLTDTALWIFKRYLNQQQNGLNTSLLNEILMRTHWDGISAYHHQQGLMEGMKMLSKRNFSAKQIKNGMALRKELESKRWKAKK